MANPTTLVSSVISISLQDIVSGIQSLSRTTPPVVFEAINVQYQGFLNIPLGGVSYNFGPLLPVTLFSVVYIRNVGGEGNGNTVVALNLPGSGGGVNVVNLDNGAFFLYASPKLGSTLVSTVTPGVLAVDLISSAGTSSNLEVLMAG